MDDTKTSMHTKRSCKYHMVFAPKYCRQIFYGEKSYGGILRKSCEWKAMKIVEVCCPEHIHMLLEISPRMNVSTFVGHLKGKSSLWTYEQFEELKFNIAIGNSGAAVTISI